jgi:hypothetical protein
MQSSIPLMNKFHKPGEEKRMVVILPLEHFGACLQAKPEKSRDFLRPYPANLLKATEASSPQQDIFGR